jgi:2,4-dienoyl-CoA reductase-like NADH-dependent reductase (Old Yellow Enzyme family)/thioredoxin reductase
VKLDEPLAIGSLTLRNRFVAAPMERNYCDTDGHVTTQYMDYLGNRALGGAALIFTEATYVRQDGKSRARQMGLSTDSHEDSVAKLAQRVHDGGALLGLELNHGGRTSQSHASGQWPVAPSPIPLMKPGADVPHELTIEGIKDIVACFGAAAARAKRAGVDVLSIHGAHGYLVQSFMSPATNKRTDEYADPTRFVGEVLDAVRENAPGIPVGIRLSAFEGNEGGLTADQQLDIFERVGPTRFDFVDISAGNYEAPAWSVQPAEFARGLLAPYAKPYRKYGIPVGVAGRINDGNTAERILQEGQADFISMARALHADASFPLRVINGQTYRPCIACNLCSDELGSGNPIRCSVNVEVDAGGDEKVQLAEGAGKSVLVVGAGPSGLEAACLLAEAGYKVDIIESNSYIGGQFALPSKLKGVPEYYRLLRWYERRTEEADVNIELGVRATAQDVIGRGADAVILATGSKGIDAGFDGAGQSNIMDIRAWLATDPQLPEAITIIGGDREAVAVGYDLANKGTRVTIIAEEEEIGLDVGTRAKILTLPYLLESERVTIHTHAEVQRLESTVIHARTDAGSKKIAVDGVLLSTLGAEVVTDLLDALDPGSYIPALIDGPNETIIEALTAGRFAARKVDKLLSGAGIPVRSQQDASA